MALRLRVVEHVLAAVLLCAALLAPSLASAHTGHSHHVPAAAVEPATSSLPAAERAADKPAMTTAKVRHEVARAAVSAVDSDVSGCASHCCGGTANMTCCGAALIPEIIVAPAFTASHRLLFSHTGALLGLPPEALPKPPRSFA